MGDASLRVQTKYPTAEALLHVVGTTLQRGTLRVPIRVAFEQPFELILASLDGDEPVSGRAEVVEHAGDATWVRFLSASPDSTEPARCVLVDTEVMSPASLTAKSETFEAITAVKDTPLQLADVPTGAAEPVRIASLPLPAPPDPLFDVSDASGLHLLGKRTTSSSSIAEAAAAACDVENAESTAVREGETTMVESRRDVDVAALAALEGRFDALGDVVPTADRVTARGAAISIGEPPAMPRDADVPSNSNGDVTGTDVDVTGTEVAAPGGRSAADEDTTNTGMTGGAAVMFDAASASDDDLRIPHTGETRPIVVDVAAESMRTELTMPALELPTTRIEPTASALGSTPISDRTTVESGPIAVIADSPPDDQRPTVESPPIVASLVQMTSGDDAVAVQRGIRAITNPYAKGGLPPSNRRVVIVAASVAAVSLLVAAGSIMWAHDAVAHAEHPRVAPVASAPVVEQPPAIVEAPPAVQPPPPTTEPTSCVLDVFSSVAESSVYLNGAANGSTPATANVECRKPVIVEIRHARYETFRRTVTPVAAREEMRATLEREKTSLHVTSEPAGASVTYNGAPIGKTPLTVKIPRYEQGTLSFSMAGMQADWRRIVPKTPEKTVTIALRKK